MKSFFFYIYLRHLGIALIFRDCFVRENKMQDLNFVS